MKRQLPPSSMRSWILRCNVLACQRTNLRSFKPIPKVELIIDNTAAILFVFQMARIARAVAPEIPHHVTQRGIRRLHEFIVSPEFRDDIYTDKSIPPIPQPFFSLRPPHRPSYGSIGDNYAQEIISRCRKPQRGAPGDQQVGR